jgi:SpoIIAA-like
MIETERLAPDALKIVPPRKLQADDFRQLRPEVDAIIGEHGKIRLLIDASRLEGWDDIAAFETHAAFVRDHMAKVERIAVIAPHPWQHWLVGAVRIFVHPEVRAFDAGDEALARQWLAG